MERLNLGCGPDIKEGWVNADKVTNRELTDPTVHQWDMVNEGIPATWYGKYDFILINHVLCTMKPHDALKVLDRAYQMLKVGGSLQVIDMDLLRVFDAYEDGRIEDIPIEFGTLDEKLCYAISGYGTRLSLYTPRHMERLLGQAGFKDIFWLSESEHDLRPKESLILEATK